MRVEIGNDVYSVSWQHRSNGDKKGTTCIVEKLVTPVNSFEPDVWKPHASTTVGLYYKDRFDKETGRRNSLTKLLSTYPRNERTKFWNAYWSR